MQLVVPCAEYQQSYVSYIEELGNEERYPFTLDLSFSDFEQLLMQLKDFSLGKNLPVNAVANSTLWLVDGLHIIGVTNIRHYLNASITHCGGHIGLGIRPSYRGKGLGNLLMRLSVDHLSKLGVNPIHIHCYKSNLSSAKTIQNNGGVLSSEITEHQKVIQRYIVNATESNS